MGDSSSDEDDNFCLYRDRPEWSDVTPIPEDYDEHQVVAIDYSLPFKDVFDYFRAILKSGEKSERALKLTKTAVSLNPANYTVWQYRRVLLKALNKDLREELKLAEHFILHQSKNYQVWHHRRILVEWLQDPSEEKAITKAVLSKDAKNYHAWQHRQWTIKTFNLFDGELDFVEYLIANDVRNNSAWNQRYFVIENTTDFTDEVLDKEIDYSLSNIREIIENESAWNYLRGILINHKDNLGQNAKVTQFCEELYASGNRSPFLLGLIVDMCYDQVTKKYNSVYSEERGKEICNELATKYDKIRARYWLHLMKMFEEKEKQECN